MKIDEKKREAVLREARNLDEHTLRVRVLKAQLSSAIDVADKTHNRLIAALRDAGLEVATKGDGYHRGGYEFSIGGYHYGAHEDGFEIDAEVALDDHEDEDEDEDEDESPDPFPVHGGLAKPVTAP